MEDPDGTGHRHRIRAGGTLRQGLRQNPRRRHHRQCGHRSQESGGSLTGTLGKAFGKIGKLGLGAIGTITGGVTALAAKGGFTRALNIENAQAKLKGLGHDANSVSEIMNNALASVKGTAFGLGDAATVAASLSAAGIASGEQMTKVLKTVADTAQISGRSLTDIGTIFGSVAARGKLQGETCSN